MGRQRDDFIPGVFCFPYGKYLILYDITPAGITPAGITPAGITPAGITPAGITIVHVIHGARDIERALKP